MTKFLAPFLLLALSLAACGSREPLSTVEIALIPTISPTPPAQACFHTAITQGELNLCAAQQAQQSQQKLDQLLEELQLKYSEEVWGERWAEFQVIEQDWQTLRDRNCTWIMSLFESGSIAPMEYSMCIARYNNQRIQELAILLCDGAGLTGPCPESQKYEGATIQP